MRLPFDVSGHLTISEGHCHVFERASGDEVSSIRLDATADCKSLQQPVSFDVSGTVANSLQPVLKTHGTVTLLQGGIFNPANVEASIVAEARDFQLANLAPLARLVPGMPHLSGVLNGHWDVQLAGPKDVTIKGAASTRELTLAGAVFKGDTPNLDQVTLDVDVAIRGRQLIVDGLELTSPIVRLSASGSLTSAASALDMTATVHLPAVAENFPHTLGLRRGMRIESGELIVKGSVTRHDALTRVAMSGNLEQLSGAVDGQACALSQPMSFLSELRLEGEHVHVDKLKMASSFLTVSGSGSETRSDLSARLDLAKALQELAQFVDLSGYQMTGRLALTSRLDTTVPKRLSADVVTEFQGVTFAGSETLPAVAVDASVQSRLVVDQGHLQDVTATGTVHRLQVSGGPLGSDRLDLQGARLLLAGSMSGSAMAIRNLTVESTLFGLALKGDWNPVKGDHYATGKLDVSLTAGLAELFRQLPATTGAKPERQISSGELSLRSTVDSSADRLAWSTKGQLSDLAGKQKEQPFAIAEPWRLSARGALTADGPALEHVEVLTGFGALTGHFIKGDVAMSAKVSLQPALAELAPFLALQAIKASGQLQADILQAPPKDNQSRVSLTAVVSDLNLVGTTPEPFVSKRVAVALSADLIRAADQQRQTLRNVKGTVDGLPLVVELACARFDTAGGDLEDGSLQASGQLSDLLHFLKSLGLIKDHVELGGPINLQGRVSMRQGDATIESFKLTSKFLVMDAAGTMADVVSNRHLNVTGSMDIDLAETALLTEALSGYRPKISGKTKQPYRLGVSLGAGDGLAVLRSLDAAVGLKADRYEAFGIKASQLAFDLTARDARIQIDFDTALNEGHLRVSPYLDVAEPPATLNVADNSQVMEGVKLTDEMASELLALIHPIFRGCAILGGELGMNMAHCRVPLGERMQADAQIEGDMIFTNVVLGPAGLLGDLLALAQLDESRAVIPDQRVRFETRDGRLYPSPLTIQSGPYKLVLTGSVGLDQTVQYWVELPITREVVGRDVYNTLGDTTVRLEITGTVGNPKISKDAYRKLVADVTKDAARKKGVEALKKEAEKQLGEGTGQVIEEGIKVLEGIFKKR